MSFIGDIGTVLPYAVGAFAAAALLALVLTPIVRTAAERLELVDHPDERRVNVRPVPRAGGLAVAAAFLVASVGFLAVNALSDAVPTPVFLERPELIALLVGGAAAALLGLIDDYLQVRARWQLVGQIVLAVWAIAMGIQIDFVASPLGGRLELSGLVAAVVTGFWIIGMINSINFIDGLDGLSSGVGLIAALTLGVISLTATIGQPMIAVLCLALAGALLGFLRWNFHPASIFIGTSGVMFLGYTLAVLSILGTAKVAIALLVLGVPIIDTFWIIVRRLASRRSPFAPDRGHLHHRLLDLGLGHRQVVLLIYAICAALAVLAVVLSGSGQLYAFTGLFVLSGIGLLLIGARREVREELDASSYPDDPSADDDRPARGGEDTGERGQESATTTSSGGSP
jgi:UDP-GlcNAc:undecaprenyl-phosphate GlcNAc-1-phosphate transferase